MALPRTSWRRRPLVALAALILLLIVGYTVRAVEDHNSPSSGGPVSTSQPAGPTATANVRTSVSPTGAGVALSSLPKQAANTITLIRKGGPYPYRQDGVVYDNLERQLPIQPPGYYHEYTVDTPGSPDRGARRIVTGRDGQFYYTANHYQSFVRVDIGS